MKVEDLIGWRIWTVKNGYLWSYSADYAWLPGGIAEGEPGDHDHVGVWAFKEKRRAFQKAISGSGATVWGSVRLWGQVVEHRDGYRASKARIVSIEGGHGIEPEKVRALCRLYDVPEPERMITRPPPEAAPEAQQIHVCTPRRTVNDVSPERRAGAPLVRKAEPKPEVDWMMVVGLGIAFSMPLLYWALRL